MAKEEPISTVPFPRDSAFVETAEYRQLDEKLSSGKRRVALTGMGGIGKSHLAVEYCHRLRERSPDCWVFWIQASSLVQSDAGLQELADELKIDGREDPYADVLGLVGEWLSDSGRRWLLVLDDVDLWDALSEPAEDMASVASTKSIDRSIERMIDFLAMCTCGQTIVTTRSEARALRFVHGECDAISFGPMEEADAVALFQSRTGEQHENNDVKRLIVELGYIPQAITYAAAFIESQEPPSSIRTYLGLLGESSVESDGTDVLTAKDNGDQDREYSEAKNPVLCAWKVSFEHLIQTRPSALDRLCWMAFLDCRKTPRSLIRAQYSTNSTKMKPEPTPVAPFIDPGLDEDVSILSKLCLVSMVPGSRYISTPPLLQLATRQWLKSHDKYDHWLSQYIKNLAHFMPLPGSYEEKMSQWRKLFPHVCWALTVAEPADKEAKVLLTNIWHGAAWYYCQVGDFRASAALLERCWAQRNQLLGNEHPDTLLSLMMLGGVQGLLGEEIEARAIFERCLSSAERCSDSNHEGKLVLAECLEKMGITELDHGRLEEAETYLRRAFGSYENLSGYHWSYDCVSTLKEVLLKRGKYAEAEGVCRGALARFTETYGNEHEYTIFVSKDLAEVLRRQGKLDEGMEIAQRVLAISQCRFGVDDRRSLAITREVAKSLRAQQKCQEAADLLEQVHRMSSDRYGKESVIALGYAHSHTLALEHIGKVDQALDVMRACAASTQHKLGAYHRDAIRRNQLVAKLELTRQRQGVRPYHEIRLERHARRKEKFKCIVQ